MKRPPITHAELMKDPEYAEEYTKSLEEEAEECRTESKRLAERISYLEKRQSEVGMTVTRYRRRMQAENARLREALENIQELADNSAESWFISDSAERALARQEANPSEAPNSSTIEQVAQVTRPWADAKTPCPKCGDHLIHNHTGTECSSMHCDYNTKQSAQDSFVKATAKETEKARARMIDRLNDPDACACNEDGLCLKHEQARREGEK